jgi:hypothetical protein
VLYSYDAVPKAIIKVWIDVSFANILTYWRLKNYVNYKSVQQDLFLMQNMTYHLFNYLKKLGWLSIRLHV